MLPAKKNQIWFVLRPEDTRSRLIYGLCATLMGRMAISGDLVALGDEQRSVLDEGLQFYREVHEVIRDGDVRLFQQELGSSYRYPEGRQTVRFHDPVSRRILMVCHQFHTPPEGPQIIPLPEGSWKISAHLGDGNATVKNSTLQVNAMQDLEGSAFLLEKDVP